MKLPGKRVDGVVRLWDPDNELEFLDPDPVTKKTNKSCTNFDVCVTFISCNRGHLLRRAMKNLVTHLNTKEPWLCYELVWIDQATPDRDRFTKLYNFHKRLLVYRRQGYPFAFNYAFNLCQAPYILIIEEDLILQKNTSFPLISHTIELLNKLPYAVYGIVMRQVLRGSRTKTVRYDGSTKYANMTAWGMRREKFRWNNGAIIARMKNVNEMLSRGPYLSEKKFSGVVRSLGMHYAILDWNLDGPPPSGELTETFFFDHVADDVSVSAVRGTSCFGESWT